MNERVRRHFSFHWQNAEGKIVKRLDNAPHHTDLPHVPHHLHIKNKRGRTLNINYLHPAAAPIETMSGVDDKKENCPNLAGVHKNEGGALR